jgi:hypothetical protein
LTRGETPGGLRARLSHVYWIGGGSGAGKSVVARRLAAEHGLRRYATDDVMAGHGRRSNPADSPYLREFAAMDMDRRWVSRSPQVMLETFHWFRGEGFGLIVEDLLGLPAGPGVIAEGFRLLPRLVQPLLADRGHAVWLCPTPRFRWAAFGRRGSLWDIAGKTSDPERALANLVERDRMFTERVRAEASDLGLRVIDVDVTVTGEELAGRVSEAFGLLPGREFPAFTRQGPVRAGITGGCEDAAIPAASNPARPEAEGGTGHESCLLPVPGTCSRPRRRNHARLERPGGLHELDHVQRPGRAGTVHGTPHHRRVVVPDRGLLGRRPGVQERVPAVGQ